MTPDPIWTARAEADLLREFAELEEISPGAGDKLLDMVDSALRLLRIMPEMAPLYAESFRRLVLKNRRIGIFYTAEARGIVVHALCGLSQDRETILRHLNIRTKEG